MQRRIGFGFTLVELLIVMVILCILMALLLPAFRSASDAGMEAEVKALLTKVDGALRRFKIDNGGYPVGADHLSGDSRTTLKKNTYGSNSVLDPTAADRDLSGDHGNGLYTDRLLKPYLENEIADENLYDDQTSTYGSGTVICDRLVSARCPKGAPILYGFWRESGGGGVPGLQAGSDGIWSDSELKTAIAARTAKWPAGIGTRRVVDGSDKKWPMSGYVMEFQLWSYGPDGLSTMLTGMNGGDEDDEDNITVTPWGEQ